MLLYAQRIEVSRLTHIDELLKACREWEVLHERVENLLKMWILIEYIENNDFWRRRLYTNDGKQINDKLITTYVPAYVSFPRINEANKTPIDIIALDRRCFDGAMEFMQQNVEGTLTAKSLSFERFPENVLVEGVHRIHYATGNEQVLGFGIPRSRKDVLQSTPTQTYRYFSMKIGTDYPLTESIQLTTIGLEEDRFALNIVMKESTDEPLRSDNEAQIIEEISRLLDKLYIDPADVCRLMA